MPIRIADPTPDWLKPENASVFDSYWKQIARRLGHLIGADDPAAQVMTPLMTGVEATGTQVSAAGQALKQAASDLPGAKRLAGFIRAYHGSPHDFEQFSTAHIGTGEGAQAYGHGLYFAENPATAEAYRTNLAGQPELKNLKLGSLNVGQHNGFDYSPRGNSIYENVRSSLAEDLLIDQQSLTGVPPDRLQAHVLNTLDGKIRDYTTEWPEAVKDAQRLRADLARKNAVSLTYGDRPGKSYEVNIKADPAHFLDWDKPISEQSPHVQQAIAKMQDAGVLGTGLDAPKTGAQLIQSKSVIAPEHNLQRFGVPGIKYLDQASRAAGEGSRNYVAFDENLIDILRKYGWLPPVAGLGYLSQVGQPRSSSEAR